MSAYNFFVSGPKFTIIFLFNTGEIALVNAIYSLSITSSLPEIFVLKVERFPKSCQIFLVFGPPKF